MRHGITNITIILIVVVGVALGGLGYYWWSATNDGTTNTKNATNGATNTINVGADENENTNTTESTNDDTNSTEAMNTNVTAPTNTNSEVEVAANTYANDDYAVEYPDGWYPHDQIDYVIFTKSEELVIPEATEGYAIGPQFITRVMAMVDANDQPLTKSAWIDQNIGDQDIDGNPIDKTEVTKNGYAMTRVVLPAAGSSGDTLTYYYFAGDQVYSLYHYPFVDGSSDSADFEELVSTFTVK